jgi:putative phosphoribosyl transferase
MWNAFRDRTDAGRQLASELREYADRNDVIVLALPRGGVPVGWEVAAALHAPLDIVNVRKLGTPGAPELAMGAIATGGVRVLNEEVIGPAGITESQIAKAVEVETHELERREQVYRGGRPAPDLSGRVAILVDDGVATGSTIKAAIRALRQLWPKEIVAAVPVGPPDTRDELGRLADRVVCLRMPPDFFAIGQWYQNFPQLTDREVCELMESPTQGRTAAGSREGAA